MPIEDIHGKIMALLELSKNNPSEQEAARAAEMARKMMLKWNIDENELKTRSPVDYSEAHDLDRDYFKTLAHIVQKATGTTFIYRTDDTFRIVGRRVNAQVAHSLLMFLADQVERMYKTFLPTGMTKAARAQYRKDFKRNCAMRMYHRSQEELRATTGTDLVLISDELQREVDAFLSTQKIRMVNSRMKINSNTLGAQHGRAAGDMARLQQAIK